MTSVCPRVKMEQMHVVTYLAGETKACGVCALEGKSTALRVVTVRIILEVSHYFGFTCFLHLTTSRRS